MVTTRNWPSGLAVALLTALGTAGCLGGADSGALITTADDLIAAHLEALGGKAAWDSIHTITSVGEYSESSFSEVHRLDRRRPNFLRITTSYDVDTGQYGYSEGYDGGAWEYRAGVPERVIGEPSRALRNASRFERPYIDYRSKDLRADLLGETDIKGNRVYHLRITHPDGDTENFFFDTSSLMETVSIGNAPFHGEGAVIEIFEKRSDYRPVGGILMPHRIEQMSGDEVLAALAWETIEANADVPDEWFSPPPSRQQAMFTELRHAVLADSADELASRYTAYRDVAVGQLEQQLENELNTFGYELISHGRFEDAIEIFRLAIRQHPASSNLHDSLGEAYLLNADTARSVTHYRRSLELNPNNGHAAEVLAQIED